ncbi:MAG: SLBB domain-containing protein [Pyrinomonadaceae bacterium]
MNRAIPHFVLFLFLCLFLTEVNSQSTAPGSGDESQHSDLNAAARIHFGDVIDVDVVGSLEFDWRGTITPEGFLDGFDTIEEQVFALCKTETEVGADISRHIGKFLKDPVVIVKVVDRSNRTVAILQGAVKSPQRLRIKRPVYLNELLVLTGGFIDTASGEIAIFRPEKVSCSVAQVHPAPVNAEEKFVQTSSAVGSKTININISDLLGGLPAANPQIYSGDIITVLEALPVYVIGGVVNPKQVSSRTQLTVSRAVASAGGVSKGGISSNVKVYRRENRVTTVIDVNLEKIEAGLSEDVLLKAYDIVEVEQKGKSKRRFPPQVTNSALPNARDKGLPIRIID